MVIPGKIIHNMKKLITILLLSITISAQASRLGEMILTPIFTGIPLVVMYSFFWYDDSNTDFWLYAKPTLDAKMISEQKIDFKSYMGLNIGRFQPYLAWEVFNQPVNLEAYTAGLDYRIIDRRAFMNIGYETGVIHNQDKWVWTNAVCMEFGVQTKYGYSIIYRADMQTRPEVSGRFPVRYNGRVGVYLPLN